MKKLDIEQNVDIDTELKNMIEYTLNTWDGKKEDLIVVITDAFNSGYKTAENWIDEYVGANYLYKAIEERRDINKVAKTTHYDEVLTVYNNLIMNPSNIKRIVLKDWDYSKNTKALTNDIKSILSISKVFPKGWESVKDSKKSAHEYFDHFNLEQDNDFKGYDSASTGAPGFNVRINLPNTFYSDSEQGRTPLNILVSSAYSHGLSMRSHNNTCELYEEIKKIKVHFENEEFQKPVFIEDFAELSNNRFFKACMINSYNMKRERPYNSQSTLDKFIKYQNQNQDIYGMVEFKTIGSDNYFYSGLKIEKIYSIEHFEKKIKENVDKFFEGEESVDLFFSDVAYTTMTKENILNSLKIKQISSEEFKVLEKVLESNGKVSYGWEERFMNYKYPTNKEIKAIQDQMMNEIMNSIMNELESEKTEPNEIQNRKNEEETYQELIFDILGIEKSPVNKSKLKVN